MRNYVGLSFPVIRVRFSGPTDHHGARYVASLRSPLGTVQHFEPFHVGPEGPSELAHKAARACWEKYLAERRYEEEEPRAFIPGDMGPDEYVFLAVPEGFVS